MHQRIEANDAVRKHPQKYHVYTPTAYSQPSPGYHFEDLSTILSHKDHQTVKNFDHHDQVQTFHYDSVAWSPDNFKIQGNNNYRKTKDMPMNYEYDLYTRLGAKQSRPHKTVDPLQQQSNAQRLTFASLWSNAIHGYKPEQEARIAAAHADYKNSTNERFALSEKPLLVVGHSSTYRLV